MSNNINEVFEQIIKEHIAKKPTSVWVFEYKGERLVMHSKKSSWLTKGQAMSALINSIRYLMMSTKLSFLDIRNPENREIVSELNRYVKTYITNMLKTGDLILKELK